MSARPCSPQTSSHGVGLIQLLLVLVVIVAITLLALRIFERSTPPPVGGGAAYPARAVLDKVTLRVDGLKSEVDALQVAEALQQVNGVASASVDYRTGRPGPGKVIAPTLGGYAYLFRMLFRRGGGGSLLAFSYPSGR